VMSLENECFWWGMFRGTGFGDVALETRDTVVAI
jgi:hypothetical protein